MQKNVDLRANYFAKVFTAKLDAWKQKMKQERNRKYTDEDFAKAIEKACGRKCSRNSVVLWKKGERYPEQYIKAICEVLGVREEAFFPILSTDKLSYDQTYIDEQTNDLKQYADSVGMSEAFLSYLESMTDFSRSFPFTQFDSYSDTFLKYNADIRKINSLYQVSDDAEHRLYLSKKDIDYVARLQVEAWRLIKALFEEERERRLEELIQEDCEIWSDNLKGVPSPEEIKQCIKTDWRDEYIAYKELSLEQKASRITQKAYFEALDKMLLENPDFQYVPRTEKELREMEEAQWLDPSPEYEEMMKRYNMAQRADLTAEDYDAILQKNDKELSKHKKEYFERVVKLEQDKKIFIEKRKEMVLGKHGKR